METKVAASVWDGKWPPPDDWGSYEVMAYLCGVIAEQQTLIDSLVSSTTSLTGKMVTVENQLHQKASAQHTHVVSNPQTYIPPPPPIMLSPPIN